MVVATTSPLQVDEAALLLRLQARDDDAFTIFYNQYSPLVRRIAQRIVHSADLVDDALQMVMLNAWRALPRFDAKRGTLAGWLSILARNGAIDLLRRASGVEHVRFTSELEHALIRSRGPLPQWVHEYEENTIVRLDMLALVRLLPPEQAKAILYVYYAGLTMAETARALGCPEGTLKTRCRRAYHNMQRLVAQQAN